MAIITAEQVRLLRERTSAGMMDCKKALVAAAGDMEKAADELRKKGSAKADNKAGRIASEGCILLLQENKRAVMLEVNSETDFVARDDNFFAFAKSAARTALEACVTQVDTLSVMPIADGAGETVEEARHALIAKVNENICVRRIAFMQIKGCLGTYLHGSRIGVLVELHGGDESLARDIAMHIAANAPLVVAPEEVPQEILDKEKSIYQAQAEASGKPAAVIEKMVEGRLKKYLNEVSLLGQPFVKNPDITVQALLKSQSATVNAFVRFEVGEGIEKEVGNFAEEVMAQVRGSSS